MFTRCIALLLCISLASCGGGGSDDDDSEAFRTTFTYFLTTGNTAISGRIFRIMGEGDMTLIQTQTGINQTAGLGFISGIVLDGTDTAIAGVTIQAHNDSGLAAGSIFYQSALTGAYTVGLTQTTTTGRFVVMNVQPGRVNIKCAAGADGNLYVQVPTGTTVFAQIRPTASGLQPTWSGVTQNLGAAGSALPGSPEASVNYQLVGTTSAPGPASDGTTGAFNLGTVPARNTFLMKCAKTAFVDTYTYIRTLNANLTSGGGGGNVLITSPTNRDTELVATGVVLAAGTGIIRGRVMDGAGGFVVQARNSSDAVVGEVAYGDNADNGRPSAVLTSTQTDGIFYVYNVPPGQVFLRATKTGQSVSTYVDVFADGITLPLDLEPVIQTQTTISVSGALADLRGFGVPEGTVALQGLGLSDSSDSFGEFSNPSVPAAHVFIVRTSK
ncbi:MAG TPA: hypothetical protein VJU16_09670 [Planctomycetota bacterium]|nr:hypothetical protein [Planctomycetota bacterium]